MRKDSREAWHLHYTTLPKEYALLSLAVLSLVVLNNAVVLTTFFRIKPFKLSYYIIIGLAIADVLTIIPLAQGLVTFMSSRIWLTDNLCDLLGVFYTGNIAATHWLHCLLCVERCISVMNPFAHKSFSLRRMSAYTMGTIVIALILLAYLVLMLGILVGTVKFQFDASLACCGLDSDPRARNITFLIFDTPKILVQLVCYTLMVNRLKNLQGADRKRIRRALKVVLLTLMLFYACFLPYYIEMIIMHNRSLSQTSPAHLLCVEGIFLNSAMSGVIYYVSIPEFKKYIKDRF